MSGLEGFLTSLGMISAALVLVAICWPNNEGVQDMGEQLVSPRLLRKFSGRSSDHDEHSPTD